MVVVGSPTAAAPGFQGQAKGPVQRPRKRLTVPGFSGETMQPDSSTMTREMSELRTNEVRAPAWTIAPPPSLHGHRWASAGLTTDLTGEPMFPDVPWRAGEERLVPFPPPPPPMHCATSSESDRRHRMMVWYQSVEQWCDEGAKADNERVIVAPPPRPPPFTSVEAEIFSLGQIQRAPYDVRTWEVKVRAWWSHISRHFDKLRQSDRYEVKGISKAPPSSVSPQQALRHAAL